MNKLTKAQREQLLAMSIGAVMLIGLLWYFGVMSMNDTLAATRKKTAKMQTTLSDAEMWIRREGDIQETLHARNEILAKREAVLAPDRDTYAWLINTMNTFLQSRKGINIDTYSQPEFTDSGILSKFPYRWATFHLRGSGYYQDIGDFFRDFENEFPYFRIENPALTVNIGPGIEPEKLSVSFDIVAPVVSSADTK
jgi:Tfp pilus assembly protein PilO